ncbi:MAG: hypothetical protein WC225_03355 [Acholeplasmataceae bacterium]
MKIKCMKYFPSLKELSSFTNELENINWRIEKEYLRDRAEFYKKVSIFNSLKEEFVKKKISIWPLKDEEVITWLDTLELLRRVMFLVFKKGIQTEKISIIMEYPIIFGNHMRTDFLLIYDRLIIVLEFGMFNQDEKRGEERYTKKLQESNSYKQLLENLISSKIDVVNYVMIYRPEYSRNFQTSLKENILYNQEELEKLCKFITHLIKLQDDANPLQQLNYLESIK